MPTRLDYRIVNVFARGDDRSSGNPRGVLEDGGGRVIELGRGWFEV